MKIFNKVWLDDSEKVNYGQLLNYTAEMLGVFAFVKPETEKAVTLFLSTLKPIQQKQKNMTFTRHSMLMKSQAVHTGLLTLQSEVLHEPQRCVATSF